MEDVYVSARSSEQLSLMAPSSVVFSPSNWDSMQNFTLRAADDLIKEGNHSGLVNFSATSQDARFAGIAESVRIMIEDNDCDALEAPQYGQFLPGCRNQYGDKCTLQCDVGRAPENEVVVQCLSNGNWDRMLPTCNTCADGYFNNNETCKLCSNQECEIGLYRGQCKLDSDAVCETCTGKPRDSHYVTTGQPWDSDNCTWTCNVGFWRSGDSCTHCSVSECPVGLFRGSCSSDADGFQFQIAFLDPHEHPIFKCTRMEVATYHPMSGSLFGGQEMVIEINYIPPHISCSDILVEIGWNVTCQSLAKFWRQDVGVMARVHVLIPGATDVISLTPLLHIRSSTGILSSSFPSSFTYVHPPLASVDTVIPSSASITSSTSCRIVVSNFPVLTSLLNIEVNFVWANGHHENATVNDLTPVAKSSSRGLSSWNIDIVTPSGPSVIEGSVAMEVRHLLYGKHATVLKDAAFAFVDFSLPSVIRMEDAESTAVDTLRVPREEETQFKLHVMNVPSSVETSNFVAVVGTLRKEIIFVSRQTVSRTAQIILKVREYVSVNMTWGMIAFGSPPSNCTAACCDGMKCKTVCGDVKLACFALEYFDRWEPAVSFSSDLVGPEIGMDVIKVHVTNFPMNSSKDALALFVHDDQQRVGRLVMTQQSRYETEIRLLIITPEFPMAQTESMKSVTVQLISLAHSRDLTVSFEYTYLAVSPELASLNPSSATSDGGTRVQVRLDYFPFPAPGGVQIRFDGKPLISSQYQVLDMTDKLKTVLSFETPGSAPGEAIVRIAPAHCSNPCRYAVYFSFLQVDSTLPVLVMPIPTEGCLSSNTLPTLSMRSFPDQLDGLTVSFNGKQGTLLAVVDPLSAKQSRDSPSVTYFSSISMPEDITPGAYAVSLIMQQSGVQKTVSFEFRVLDCTLPRVIDLSPTEVPTVLQSAGRKLMLKTRVSITLANVQLALSDLIVTVGSSAAEVVQLSVKNFCPAPQADCNRTVIVINSPALESPGLHTVHVSSVTGSPSPALVHEITYTQPCDATSYCNSFNLIFDYKAMLAHPSVSCSMAFCLDPSKVGDPQLTSFAPSEGLTSGGTLIRVGISDLPVFFIEDLTATVFVGAARMFVQVVDLVQSPSSSLQSGSAYVVIRAPEVSVDVHFVTFTISAHVYGNEKSISFQFEYIPVITGSSIAIQYTPRRIYDTQDLDVLVELSNFPRLREPYNTSKILFTVEDSNPMPVKAIVASDRTRTSLRVQVPTPSHGSWPDAVLRLRVFHEDRGLINAANLTLTVTPVPGPTVLNLYPAQGNALESHIVRVVVGYLPIDIVGYRKATVIFMPTGTVANASIAQDVSGSFFKKLFVECPAAGSCCSRVHCSRFEAAIQLKPLGPFDSSLGGPALVRFSADAGIELEFRFQYVAAGDPEIEAVIPRAQGLLSAGRVGHEISLYLKNFPSLSCKKTATCASEADSLSVLFGSSPGRIVSLQDMSGMLLVKVLAAKTGSAGTVESRIISLDARGSNLSLSFDFQYVLPDAESSPLDGISEGGGLVTVSAKGWGPRSASLTNTSELQVYFQGVQATVVKLASAVYSSEISEVKALVKVPESLSLGTVQCKIQTTDAEKTSQFLFDYFQQPKIVSINPPKATLAGKTTSADGQCVTVTIENFPFVASAGDVLVNFGSTECTGTKCMITSMESVANKLRLSVRVPRSTQPGAVVMSFRAKSQPAHREPRRADAFFLYYVPLAVVKFVQYCKVCAAGRMCIVNGRCGDGSVPLQDRCPISGGGVLSLDVEDFPAVSFHTSTGVVDTSEAVISLDLGSSGFGTFERVAHASGEREARYTYEFRVPTNLAPAKLFARLSVNPTAMAVGSSAAFQLEMYDDTIVMRSHASEGRASGGNAISLSIVRFPYLAEVSASDQLDVYFGSVVAANVLLDHINSSETRISVVAPIFDCQTCAFESGRAHADLVVILKSDPSVFASTPYIFRAPPKILHARFDALGMSIKVVFDQPTNRGGMTPGNMDCASIWDHASLSSFGRQTQCTWQTDDTMRVLLQPGGGATIEPGDTISLLHNVLTSKDKVTDFTSDVAVVELPEFPEEPAVSLTGPEVVDPCSDLTLTAFVSSPRLVSFTWACRNDEHLNEILKLQDSAVLNFASGTPDMASLDKTYVITVQATNFLGVSSSLQVLKVLKQSSPAPQLSFIPSILHVRRADSPLLKAHVEFSKCPIPQEAMFFSWRQNAGPVINVSQFFDSIGSEIALPPWLLLAGKTYDFVARVESRADASKWAEGK